MTFVQPARRRSSTTETPEGIVVTIPQRRNWLLVAFLLAWGTGWCFGELSAIQEVMSVKAEVFLFVWLAMWTIGGFMVAYVLLRQLTGFERIRLSAGRIVIENVVAGFPRRREYDVTYVRAMRVAPHLQRDRAARLWLGAGVPIAFDYGAETVTFAESLDEAESAMVVRELATRLPRGA